MRLIRTLPHTWNNFHVWTRFILHVKAAGIDAQALTAWLFAGTVGEDRRASIAMQKALDAGDGFNAPACLIEPTQPLYAEDLRTAARLYRYALKAITPVFRTPRCG